MPFQRKPSHSPSLDLKLSFDAGGHIGNAWDALRMKQTDAGSHAEMPMGLEKRTDIRKGYMPNDKAQTTDFRVIVHAFDKLGYDISFKDYMDSYGPGHTAVATSRTTKRQRTMTDRYEARNCDAIAAKLLAKLQSEAA